MIWKANANKMAKTTKSQIKWNKENKKESEQEREREEKPRQTKKKSLYTQLLIIEIGGVNLNEWKK